MGESKELVNLEEPELSLANAIHFVNRCRGFSIDQLVNQLDTYINVLRNAIKGQQWEEVEPVVHVIIKGFKRICQETDALKYYYLGYYSHLQEDLIESFTKNLLQDKLQQIVTTKHTQEILEYLFESGCSRQSEIAKKFRLNRSNLSRKMDLMVSNSLVIKRSGTKCVFYELSAKGYDLCRSGGVLKKPFNNMNNTVESSRSKFILSKHDFEDLFSNKILPNDTKRKPNIQNSNSHSDNECENNKNISDYIALFKEENGRVLKGANYKGANCYAFKYAKSN